MRIATRDPQSEETKQPFLEIRSLFSALHAVTDYSFYDLALLAKSQL